MPEDCDSLPTRPRRGPLVPIERGESKGGGLTQICQPCSGPPSSPLPSAAWPPSPCTRARSAVLTPPPAVRVLRAWCASSARMSHRPSRRKRSCTRCTRFSRLVFCVYLRLGFSATLTFGISCRRKKALSDRRASYANLSLI